MVRGERWNCSSFSLPVYPNVVSLSLVAVGNKYEYESRVDFWDNVYGGGTCVAMVTLLLLLWLLMLAVLLLGFKMRCMKEEVLREAAVTVVDEYSLISSADVIKVMSW